MDAVQQAIARARSQAVPISVELTLPTGRRASITIPQDITLQEAAALAMHVGGYIHQALQQAQARRDAEVNQKLAEQAGGRRAPVTDP